MHKAGAMHIGQTSIGTLAQSRAMHVTERSRLIPRRTEYMADHRQYGAFYACTKGKVRNKGRSAVGLFSVANFSSLVFYLRRIFLGFSDATLSAIEKDRSFCGLRDIFALRPADMAPTRLVPHSSVEKQFRNLRSGF